ncbi:TetR/AcrR family transcriptional regulator [Actinomadura sp. DC4]|uniref:TetR/AcrR family transcriptional regulator n=1 Tax=Actinomadura sp. DC4 TaxID=3055069 RepID=UPI0025B03E66|nr:TetR/AcrR family transcriptional regulator [Actinomadura sp. DC4]MDN3359500.1 TetR/AcrR family transcriptional regulator [Actinomadura sp. DC4]
MDVAQGPVGRRERKKAATRAHLADTALALFLEKGYENVTVRDVAAAADVSPTTLLNHFSTKEALVVDLGDELAEELRRVVVDRETRILDALREYARDRVDRSAAANDPDSRRFMTLVLENRDLSDYWRKTWMGHENVLAAAIREAIGAAADDLRPEVTAHFVLDAIAFAIRSADPRRAVDTAFDVIVNGTSIE